jgi:hypothetical protein
MVKIITNLDLENLFGIFKCYFRSENAELIEALPISSNENHNSTIPLGRCQVKTSIRS